MVKSRFPALFRGSSTSYSKAFNKRYGRTGTLFEGPFKSVHVDKEQYLVHCCRYIHRNPLVAGLVEKLEEWKYSNYLEWIGCRDDVLIDREFVKEYFATPDEYKKFVLDYEPPPREVEQYFSW
ncbi:MAG: hypothetical protein HYR76_07210 [Ignavibacteria bacterium]|nr:hypothetical protein [Ignavibacteria bacterium]